MSLSDLVRALADIAPLIYAEAWDNVGLLVEPPQHWDRSAPVNTALLAIDLTEAVLAEALEVDAQAIVAYHPPVFTGFKRLTASNPQHRVLLRCVQQGVAVYSPHTALDATRGGINDWLVEGLGATTRVEPLTPRADDPEVGAGRMAWLAQPTGLDALVARLKTHLRLAHVRVASGDPGRPVERVAVCPGAGGSLFADEWRADLYLTGEMRHHDVLAKVAANQSVVLTDHTNTERGYLPVLARRLADAVPGLSVQISAVDQDPLKIT